MEKSYVKKVADTILEQLKVVRTELWAWGAKNYYYIEREVEGVKYPALMFTIRTPKVKRGGRVIISLNDGSDEYIVEAIRVPGDKEFSIGIVKEIHAEELHSTINSLIEDEETKTLICF